MPCMGVLMILMDNLQSQSQSQNYFIEPYTMKMQISFFFNKVQHLTIIWEMNTFMQSHSHTLIMKLAGALENINMYTIT